MHETILVGEAVAGESSQTRAILESIIAKIDKHTFDVAELLYQVESKGLYAPDFNTYKEYTRSLKLKDRKAEYLPKIIKVMQEVGFTREQYEKLGIARLREITSLKPDGTWTNPETGEVIPLKVFIVSFVEKGEEIDIDELKAHIRLLKGLVGENDLTFLNLCYQRKVMDETVRPGIEKVKAYYGSVGKDDDGISKDITDSKAVEMALVEVLSNPLIGEDEQ